MAENRAYADLTPAGRARSMRQIAGDVLLAWPLDVRRFTRLAQGFNTTFRVDAADGSRWVLRVHRRDGPTPAMIQSELSWLAALRRDTDLTVPAPVPTRDGQLISTVRRPGGPEEFTCDLLGWIPGRFVDAALTPAHLRRVGQLTGALHNHASRWSRPEGFQRGRADNVSIFAESQPDNLSSEVESRAADLVGRLVPGHSPAVVGRVIASARAARAALGRGPEEFGLIHGDLHQENYLFAGGGIGAIDFDDCGFGLHTYDLAVTSSELRQHPGYLELRRALVDGYREVRPLSTTAEAAIPALIAFRYLLLMMYDLEHLDPSAARPDLTDQTVRRLGQLELLSAGHDFS